MDRNKLDQNQRAITKLNLVSILIQKISIVLLALILIVLIFK